MKYAARARCCYCRGEGLGSLQRQTARLPDSGSGHDDLETSLSISGLGRVTGVCNGGQKEEKEAQRGALAKAQGPLGFILLRIVGLIS